MDSDVQPDDEEVLDDIGDEQEPLNEGNHESSPTMAFHQPSSLSFSQNTWDNMIDPTPPFEKPTQSIRDPTQEFYVGLLLLIRMNYKLLLNAITSRGTKNFM